MFVAARGGITWRWFGIWSVMSGIVRVRFLEVALFRRFFGTGGGFNNLYLIRTLVSGHNLLFTAPSFLFIRLKFYFIHPFIIKVQIFFSVLPTFQNLIIQSHCFFLFQTGSNLR